MSQVLIIFHTFLSLAFGAFFSKAISIIFEEVQSTSQSNFSFKVCTIIISLWVSVIAVLATAVVIGLKDVLMATVGLGEMLKGGCQFSLLFYLNDTIMTTKNSQRNPWIAWRSLIAGISLGISLTVSLILVIFIGIREGNTWSMISAWLCLSSVRKILNLLIPTMTSFDSNDDELGYDGCLYWLYRHVNMVSNLQSHTNKKQYREVIFLNLLPSILYAIAVINRSSKYHHPITMPKLSILNRRSMSIKGPRLPSLGNNHSSKTDVVVKSPTQTLIIQMRSETGVNQMQAIAIKPSEDSVEDLKNPSNRSSSLDNPPQDRYPKEFKHKSHLSEMDSMFDNHSFYSLQSNSEGAEATCNQIPKLLEEGKLEARLAVIKTNRSTIQADGEGYVIEEWPEIHMVKKIKLEPRAFLLPSQRPKKLTELENDSLEDILSTPKPVNTSTPVLMELSDLRKNLVAPPPPISSSSSRFKFSSPEFRSDRQNSRRPSSPGFLAQTAMEEIRKLFPPKLNLSNSSSRKDSSISQLGLIGESNNEEDDFWGRHKRAAKRSYLSSHFYQQPIKKGFSHHFEMKSRWKSDETQSSKNQQSTKGQLHQNDVYRALDSYRFGKPVESPPAVEICETEEIKSTENDNEIPMMITPTKDHKISQEGLKRRRLASVLDTNQLIHRLATKSVDNLLLGCGLVALSRFTAGRVCKSFIFNTLLTADGFLARMVARGR
ncbi:uncharacterized protein MELLADRAFT_107799 [Melampsora larici-populina 98AG31]|uniref:Transmembrane protein n=1 Tax=Melampsora larici-populina (strain 98AG31 / pathotype 3-4-7) TaxID=747676 RepID=F4RQZ3_MELLP|nr:uncharacterized protein MELLADRAFT_107799 [Melampsora larici-populina 98AG31]EGG05238.1 hypothetical protein MELLADRAFT_107799 [Melampsora larici-populina 98AG31]